MKYLFVLLALLTTLTANAGAAPAHKPAGHRFGLFGRFHAHKMLNGRRLVCHARH